MKIRAAVLAMFLALSLAILPSAHAEPTVEVIMEKTTYSYCEKLFYTIKVSEVTGNPAIIHIRDEAGKGSSAIPIAISELENPVPSRMAFEKEIFPLGKYYIDVEYEGQKVTAEFSLIDKDNICLPVSMQSIFINWLSGNISDGFIIDAFEKFVDDEIIKVPFEINQDNVYNIDIPDWVRENSSLWWYQGLISDEELVQIFKYLLDEKIISIKTN
ncbi:MAG: hypothetical protein EA447_05525 [Nitrosopumilus sp.]|nr:MAG: hypothetical protein EA447_05525 [Nitrosopumilus sp.]